MRGIKCGINPKSNVDLLYYGGCRQELPIEEAYRCTGCGVWFHKDCIFSHFEKEKAHDWGRARERKEIIKMIEARAK